MAVAEVSRDAVPGLTETTTRPHGEYREQIGIRDCTDADLSFVLSLLNEEIEHSPFVYAESPVTLDDRRAWLSSHRAAGLPVLIAVDTDGAALGWGSLSPYRPSSGYRFTVEASIYVADFARRRGIAARLLEALEHAAIDSGKHLCVASIDSDNASSIRLFRRFGYRVTGRMAEAGRKFNAWRTQLLLCKQL